ncbi:Transposase [Oopsacas minuta]|uniref:Transposase n=1 Tax=Oopsacas minuta TaxID=111878 RepID=A0AAV7JH63_9METZ|nr:Transposase [Oopsacas minuta]
MARELSVNHETMKKLVVEDLWLRSFTRKKVHHLNPSIQTKKLVISKALLQRFVLGPKTRRSSQVIIFTGKEACNRLNDRILATSSTNNPRKPEIHR